jgi:hypothetical protein
MAWIQVVMSKVSSFTIAGIDCWFNSQDHRPPHFHARRKGQWHVRVFFLMPKSGMIEPVTRHLARMAKADRNALREMGAAHREELLGEWEEKVHHNE